MIRILIVSILVYYGIKLAIRYLLPLFFKKIVNHHARSHEYQNTSQSKKYKEGETIIDKKPKSSKKSNIVGEYVDFEEVKNDNDERKL